MATAAPFVKLLRQLSNAKDEYRSGALDIAWEGGKATIFIVFGQPNHAVYEAEGAEQVEGSEALTALVNHLPRKFKVAPWRKEVVRTESLRMSMDELVEPFAQLAGAASEPEPASQQAEPDLEDSAAAPVSIRLEGFPLLPLGESMWSDAAASVLHLDVLIPKLPTALVVLTGTKLRAAAIVIHGSIVDAIWVDEDGGAAGEGAAMALIGAREGTLSGYRMPSGPMAEALTMLWRSPTAFSDLPLRWLDVERFISEIEEERRDRVLHITTPEERGVALFMGGRFVCGYTEKQRQPQDDIAVIRALLAGGEGSVTVLQRAGDRATQAVREESYHLRGDELAAARGAGADLEAAPTDEAAGTGEALAVGEPPAGDDGSDEPSEAAAGDVGGAGGRRAGDDGHDEERGTLLPLFHVEPPAGDDVEAEATTSGWAPRTRDADPGEHAPQSATEAPAATATVEPDDNAFAPEDPGNPEIDFNGIRADLVQIGVRWLGSDDVSPIAGLIERTRNQVDDFVSTIEAIRSTPVQGHDPSVIRAMAREMHYYAAEALCGA